MKKVIFSFIIILTLCFQIKVNAASASISVNKSTIEKGSSVKATVSVNGAAAWNIKITSSGSTTGCNSSFADASSNGKNTNKSFTVTCESMATGLINISFSGDITSEDGTNQKVSGSKTVKVTEPRAKSTNNDLGSLSVEGYEISPAFDKNTLEYSVDVPDTVNSIIINARAADSYASLTGAGEVEVTEGSNKFEIVVTSETGKAKTYTLTVNVEDKDPIEVTVDGKTYTVVKNAKVLTMPDLFTETTVEINGFTIPAFYNELANITLVGLKDEEGNIALFIYNDGEYKLYKELKVGSLILMLLDNDKKVDYFKKSTILINEIEYDCLKTNEKSEYALFYGMNLANGEESYYMYDSKEQTLQRYNDELIKDLEKSVNKKDKNIKLLCVIAGGILLFTIIIIIILGGRIGKLKNIIFAKNVKRSKE